ncbi:MAG TPA: cytidine deaminase [Cryomorphaceae bacterium]|nr:cytidine deaminase [Cryomorphaceae bacterium]
MSRKIEISLESYDSQHALAPTDRALLDAAIARLGTGHAPYSGFHVSAAVRTDSGAVYVGTNQENASYPVGICAERVVLSVSNMQSPNEAILEMALVYRDPSGHNRQALAPCGMCRQALREQTYRQKKAIRLIMGTEDGEILATDNADELLPISFTLKP